MKTWPLWSYAHPSSQTWSSCALRLAWSRDSHILCPVSCYLIQLGYKKIHENLTYFLFCLGIYLWQSSKNLNSKLLIIWARILLEKYWYDMCSVIMIITMIITHVFILKYMRHHQAISITLCKSLIFNQSLWKATKPQQRATDIDKPHVRSQLCC